MLLEDISDIKIVSFNGGSKDNAIANRSEIVFLSNLNVKSIIDKNLSGVTFKNEDKNVEIKVSILDDTQYNYISN